MTKDESLQFNMIRTQGSCNFIFDDHKLFPSKIILNSETYGSYVLIPAAYLNYIGNWKKTSEINGEVRRCAPGSVYEYIINEAANQSVEFVIYLCDKDENKNWYENNKDNPNCKILIQYPEYKEMGLPVASNNLRSKLEKIYQKYPTVDPKNN